MKKIFLPLLLVSLFLSRVSAQCTETNETKVLLVGDSWASFMHINSNINNVFKTWGFSNYKYLSNSNIAVNGAETDDFMQAGKQAEIRTLINDNPSIEIVHLSIGGNDFLGDWNVNMTQTEVDTLGSQVMYRLDSVIRFIKSCKPGIKILWSGYCYTNFKEVITGFLSPTNHPFYNTWHGMGDPDFIQINTMQNYISQKVEEYCSQTTDVYYINATSLMQYVYGQPTAMSVPPSGTYAAHTQSIPLGDPNYPSPKASMLDWGFTRDCFHLTPEAYAHLISYHTQKFYHKQLMDDAYMLAENTSQTGSVSSTGAVSSSLFVGENSGEQFSTVLSFNTSAMADTTLRKASLFLRRKALTGTNPVTSNIEVKIKSGSFGTTANVEAADFSAAGDAAGNPCLFGSNSANDDWVRLDLPVSVLPFINNNNNVQFIISTPGASGGKTEFYDATDPDFAPVLNTAYGETPSAISEVNRLKDFRVYPNPTNGRLTIEVVNEVVKNIEVSNLLGASVLQPQLQNNTIDISALPAGMYMLNITTANGKASQRIVKE
ncbi:MAG TPA: T9SS type A sorting domain-containing protein [Chitinophagales bacterium]|nr:T9SS type A sorting domain-containing protein [Chitinophagales bacterium]HLP50656.1 T9SS type A sorting domain-containing protein [Chitinophagales bacterium]